MRHIDSLWQTDGKGLGGAGVENRQYGMEVRAVQRCPLSCKGSDEVWTWAGFVVTARAWIAASGHMRCGLSAKFDLVAEKLKTLQNSSQNISATLVLIHLCSVPLCSHLSHLDDVCVKPGEVRRVLWSSLTTSPSIFRLESWLYHIFDCLTGTDTLELLFCSSKPAAVMLSSITLTRYNMCEHTWAELKERGITTKMHAFKCCVSGCTHYRAFLCNTWGLNFDFFCVAIFGCTCKLFKIMVPLWNRKGSFLMIFLMYM